MPRKKKAIAVKEIRETIKRVAPEDVAEVLKVATESAASKAQERLDNASLPGQTVNGLKKPWTFQAMVDRFPIVNFIPEETIPLIWNGVRHQCYAGVESHVPKPFYDLYLRHKAEARRAGAAFPKDQGFEVTIGLGAGALS